jgi:hypothetical protein
MKSLQNTPSWLTVKRPAKIEALRQTLIEGEESGPDSPLNMEEIRREARKEAGLV